MFTIRQAMAGLAAAVVLSLTAAPPPPVHAAEDGGTTSRGLGGDVTCRQGFIYNPQRKICVPAQSGILPDTHLAAYAYLLAEKGRYREALATLDLMADPNTAVALNYRGYFTRKLGRVDDGISYYLQAVAIDPAYPQVREYLGEAYVATGRLDLARQQLQTIEALCGTSCEYYVDLAEAIAAAGEPPLE